MTNQSNKLLILIDIKRSLVVPRRRLSPSDIFRKKTPIEQATHDNITNRHEQEILLMLLSDLLNDIVAEHWEHVLQDQNHSDVQSQKCTAVV